MIFNSNDDTLVSVHENLIATAAIRVAEMDYRGDIDFSPEAEAAGMSSDDYIANFAGYLAKKWEQESNDPDDNYDFFLEREILAQFPKKKNHGADELDAAAFVAHIANILDEDGSDTTLAYRLINKYRSATEQIGTWMMLGEAAGAIGDLVANGNETIQSLLDMKNDEFIDTIEEAAETSALDAIESASSSKEVPKPAGQIRGGDMINSTREMIVSGTTRPVNEQMIAALVDDELYEYSKADRHTIADCIAFLLSGSEFENEGEICPERRYFDAVQCYLQSGHTVYDLDHIEDDNDVLRYL